MTQTKNLRNDTVYRRFLTGDDSFLRNKTGTLKTRTAPDGTVLLVGYGHNLYAERTTDGEVTIYVGNREWAWEQYPDGKPGKPTTARHIDNLISEAEEVGVDFTEDSRDLRTAGTSDATGDLGAIGRLGLYQRV